MERTVRRARLLSTVVAVLLGAAASFVLAGCGGVSVADDVVTLEGIAHAAQTSADATSGRFGFVMEMTAPDGYETISFSGAGSFDAASGRTAMRLDMSSFASLLGGFPATGAKGAPDFGDPELWKVDAVQDGLVMYMRFPLLSSVVPGGKPWVKLDLGRASRLAGVDVTQLQELTSNDPRDALRYLEAVGGTLERVGEEELRGVGTVQYRTTIDFLKVQKLLPAEKREELGSMLQELVKQSGLRMIPVDVWVDESSLVRKMQMTMSATQPGTFQTFEVSMRLEFYDYGEKIDIALPPAAQVVDAAALES